jgi:hypothetical protein
MTEHAHSQVPSSPSVVVATFATLDEAERAVDFLADRSLALHQIALITSDLRLVGRRALAGCARAAIDRAVSGAVGGALFGFVLGALVSTTPPASGLELALSGVTIGAVGGCLFALGQRAFSRRARDTIAVRHLQARRYGVLVTLEAAEGARRLLDELMSRAR